MFITKKVFLNVLIVVSKFLFEQEHVSLGLNEFPMFVVLSSDFFEVFMYFKKYRKYP